MIEGLIPLLESEELLDEKIKDAYEVLREDEEIKMSDEEVLSSEEELRVANEACRVLKEEEVEKEEKEEEQQRYEEEDDDDYKQPLITLTVAEMIEALSKLPSDAKLVITESGFYSNSEFAEVMLPRPGLTGFYNSKKECEILWNDEEEIKTNQIQISTQNNKNGYIILAQDGYDDYEVYGYTEKNEEAENIAKEAVKTGKQRLDYDETYDEEDVYNNANAYYRSIIVDLDTRRTICEYNKYDKEEDK